MPSCVLTTSQRLHPIPSAFTEGPTACFMGLRVGMAKTQVLIHHHGFDAFTSGICDVERRMEQR